MVAHFSARGMTYEAIEQEALEDLLLLRTSPELKIIDKTK